MKCFEVRVNKSRVGAGYIVKTLKQLHALTISEKVTVQKLPF